MEELYRKMLAYDDAWCNLMGFFNPYTDSFESSFTTRLPMFDKRAFNLYPKYNFVYDKLWVMQSQNITCGKLESITKDSNITYPIFIKPRWGHKSASSKNCFKISSFSQLQKYQHIKEMMWSEFIEGTENMTDYVLLNGNIIYEITYLYSDEQNGYTEQYKFISPNNKAPTNIKDWVNEYLIGYSGVVNVQYRNNIIIEAGLRLARGGAYIQSTDNTNIIDLINTVYDSNRADHIERKTLNFTPYYSFKCFTRFPIVYLYPQYIVDGLMYIFNAKPFYEYYFEPNGNDGNVIFQFLHEDKEIGKRCSTIFTLLFILVQLIVIVMVFYMSYLFYKAKYKTTPYLRYILYAFILFYITQYLNPISVHYNLYKAKKQKTLW